MADYGFDALSVHVLVNLHDPESVVGVKAVAEWAADQDQIVRVWPFLREPINTAAEVPKGTPDFEAYKARRGLARRRYKDQERQRNLQRLSLNHLWSFTAAGAVLAHWGLFGSQNMGCRPRSLARLFWVWWHRIRCWTRFVFRPH